VHHLERTVDIEATPETVFRFFTDSDRWARWWGAGSTIDARIGGRLLIKFPGGTEVLGSVKSLVPNERIVFTYGYASRTPIEPEASTVTIILTPTPSGTRLQLTHEFSEELPRDQHIQGWRFQLSLFANVVADELHARAAPIVDQWFAAWAIRDEAERRSAFAAIAAPDAIFQDRYSSLTGIDDIAAHAGVAQQHMPGVKTTRSGDIEQCQGTVIARWSAAGGDGRELLRGVTVFELGSDGRIRKATGFVDRFQNA
jgi:uncharacterized protein YndB with AHSA1/START domain